MIRHWKKFLILPLLLAGASAFAANPAPHLLNEPVDVSLDFHAPENFYYLADQLTDFNPATHSGKIVYKRSQLMPSYSFNHDAASLSAAKGNEFPDNQ